MKNIDAKNDKERILLTLVNRVYRQALYGPRNKIEAWKDMQPSVIGNDNPLEPGDLVTAMTTFAPNAFIVGYVQEVRDDCVVIREIGSSNTCNYYNERFLKIDKSILGYEIFEGEEYRVYKKVLTAFTEAEPYSLMFHSIRFDGKTCTITGRTMFHDDAVLETSFRYNSKTTIKSIRELIEQVYRKQK